MRHIYADFELAARHVIDGEARVAHLHLIFQRLRAGGFDTLTAETSIKLSLDILDDMRRHLAAIKDDLELQ